MNAFLCIHVHMCVYMLQCIRTNVFIYAHTCLYISVYICASLYVSTVYLCGLCIFLWSPHQRTTIDVLCYQPSLNLELHCWRLDSSNIPLVL